MTLILYGLKNCDTCKKALKALDSASKPAMFVDIRAEANLSELLPKWIDAVGIDQLANKRSTTWRNLSDTDKAKVEQGNAKDLMIENPTLVKRPVLEFGQNVYVGWTKDVQNLLIS